jgi:hypothetical protein
LPLAQPKLHQPRRRRKKLRRKKKRKPLNLNQKKTSEA